MALGSIRETQALLDILDEIELVQIGDAVVAGTWKLIQNPGGR